MDGLENRFTYHAPDKDKRMAGMNQGERYTALRERGYDLAKFIEELSPSSREQSLAITKLEECIFWANAAIARNE